VPAAPGTPEMQRREALKLLAASAALPLLSREALALFQEVHDQLPETAALKTLNPHQNATVIAISEGIIPQTKTPGAQAARVNEFIDVVLSDWCDEQDRNSFLKGLDDFDSRCRYLLGKNFVDCSAEEQTHFLQIADSEGPLTQARSAENELGGLQQEVFFAKIKQLTLIGYYTSEIGFEQELHKEIIPSRHAGCVSLEEEAAN